MTETVLTGRNGPVATVTLNRPDALNALDYAMWTGIADAFERLAADETVRCVVLRGAGQAAFCPGQDINEFAERMNSFEQALDYAPVMAQAYRAVYDCPHPTVALIHGVCTGGGLAFALQCDLRHAGAGARFGFPISRIGVALNLESFRLLMDVVGYATALEILLEARVFGAEEAVAKGLVTRVHPDDGLEAAVAEIAARIAAGAPLVNRWHKEYARRLARPEPLSEEEIRESFRSFGTEDFREGWRSFLEKRKPAFKGR